MSIISKESAIRREVRNEQGFKVYVLSTTRVRIAVVPELGAKIISVKDLQSGREWMWHPHAGRKLFRNRPGDDFSQSPLVGMDECLPTIAPCCWKGRALPDHGEAWTNSWLVDDGAWETGRLRTITKLRLSPFQFGRSVELWENEVRLNYRLRNEGGAEEAYLWALHPLLGLHAGDRLELPASTRALLNGEKWIDALDSEVPEGNCAKAFAAPLSEGLAAIDNPGTGNRLEFEWNPAANNTLGLWLTRGGWHGHHHLAVEPSNGEPDALDVAAARKRCGLVAPHASVTWQLCLRVGR
jgi:hypothetical protein